MGVDEQKEEREVLDSIFPDEIAGEKPGRPHFRTKAHQKHTDISETEYRISIKLEVPSEVDGESEPRTSFPCLMRVLFLRIPQLIRTTSGDTSLGPIPSKLPR
jgi:hypothetical protein